MFCRDINSGNCEGKIGKKNIKKKIKSFIRSIPVIGRFLIFVRTIFRKIKPGGPYWKYDFKAKQFHWFIKKIKRLIPDEEYKIVLSKNEDVHIVLKNGIKFWWIPENPLSLLGMPLRGNFEPECTSLITKLIKQGDIVFDIGANFGWYSCYFAQLVGTSGKIHVFEPTNVIEELKRNIELNGFTERLVFNKVALSDEEGEATLFVPIKLGTAFASLRKHNSESREKFFEIKVPIRKLDNYCKKEKVSRIDFMKIDVEGNELYVLKGAENVLEKFSPIIMLEIQHCHTRLFGYTPEDLLNFLDKFGYYVFEIECDGTLKSEKNFDNVHINFLAVKDYSVLDHCGLVIK